MARSEGAWKMGAWMLAATLVLGVAGGARAADTSPVKIGWLSSLTGPLSSAAIAENQGVQFAVDEINKAGGIDGRKIELLTRDTAGDPTKAVNLAQQLLFSDKVHFIIGPVNSGESLATVPVVSKAGIPNLVIGVVDELIDAKKYPRAFRAINTNEQWISVANDYLLNKLKRTKIAMLSDTTGYGTASGKKAETLLAEKGIKPVYTAYIDPNKTDLTDEMGKARASGADVVVVWSAATGLLARMLNTRGELQWDVPVVGHPSLMGLPVKPLLNRPENWEKVYSLGYAGTTYGKDGKLPEPTTKLMEAIRPALGGKIDFTFWWVTLGYDCVKIIEHAVKKAGGTDPAALQKALEETSSLRGVFAEYSWSPAQHNGFPDKNVVMNLANTFKDGSFELAPQ
jgi:branched-chain amino acid transport system substrate-binding protein